MNNKGRIRVKPVVLEVFIPLFLVAVLIAAYALVPSVRRFFSRAEVLHPDMQKVRGLSSGQSVEQAEPYEGPFDKHL